MSTDIPESGFSRRTFLRYGAAAGTAASIGLSGCMYSIGLRQREEQRRKKVRYRRKHGYGGVPVSFASQRKRIRKKDADIIAQNSSELLDAIKTSGAVIWIPGNVTIDLTGHPSLLIAPGVTIASNRHLGSSDGALIRFDNFKYLFVVPQGGARLTGLRLRGPRTKYRDFSTEDETYANAAYGIWFAGSYGIVDDCEMWGWPGYAIGAGTINDATQIWIHHNEIHHNQMGGLGYAFESLNGMSLVEWNYFSHYRHVVSGFGYKSNGYEFRCNVVGPPDNPDPANFACDMHNLGEQDGFSPSNMTAGKYVNAHHNVFESTAENALSISGIPTKYARFTNNWVAHSNQYQAIYVYRPSTLKDYDNHFGKDSLKPGRKWLKKMSTKIPLSNGKPSLSAWSPSQNRKKNKDNNNGKKENDNGKKPRTTTSKK